MPEILKLRGKFESGQVVFTPGTIDLLAAGYNLFNPLARHLMGDWGDVGEHDKQENDFALEKGNLRIFSVYRLNDGVKVWIITEADRSVTTILLPSEY